MGSIEAPLRAPSISVPGTRAQVFRHSGILGVHCLPVYHPMAALLSYTPKLPKTLFFQAFILEFPAPS